MRRSDQNPVLTRFDIKSERPELNDVSSVFNPGAIKIGDQTHLLLRVQNRGRETVLVKSESDDGLRFRVDSEPTIVSGLEALGWKIFHTYDPRITIVDNKLLVTLAVDTDEGCRAVVTQSDDLKRLEYVGQMWAGEARNGVLFPEKINGKYIGLVRPNIASTAAQPISGSEIWLVESSDLTDWKPVKSVLTGRPHYWDELIGSGPPPVKTREGWLHVYHGIATHFESVNIYQAGVCLLGLNDPSIVIARSRYNILEPRTDYELTGQVPNVVFPSGMIVASYDPEGYALPDSEVSIYYGGADTVVALATTTIQELIDNCYAGSK